MRWPGTMCVCLPVQSTPPTLRRAQHFEMSSTACSHTGFTYKRFAMDGCLGTSNTLARGTPVPEAGAARAEAGVAEALGAKAGVAEAEAGALGQLGAAARMLKAPQPGEEEAWLARATAALLAASAGGKGGKGGNKGGGAVTFESRWGGGPCAIR